MSVLTRFFSTGLGLLADCLLHPSFPTEELERVRLQRIASLKQAKADAGFLADSLFSRLVFGDHPYGHEASGTESSVAKVKREDILALYQSYFGANNAFLVAVGDVPTDLLEQLERAIGNFGSVHVPSMWVTAARDQKGVRVGLVEKPSAVQSAIRVGHIGLARNSADYIPVYVMNMLLGGYFNSRINLNLREKHGFTYGARSYFDTRVQAGPFVVSTEVRTEVTVRAVEEILSEVRRIVQEEVSDAELEMVKNYVIGSFPLQIETPQQVAARVATIALYGLEKDYFDSYRTRVAQLTKQDLRAAAGRYLRPEQTCIVLSGDVEALKEGSRVLGPVTVYSAEGEVIGSVND